MELGNKMAAKEANVKEKEKVRRHEELKDQVKSVLSGHFSTFFFYIDV